MKTFWRIGVPIAAVLGGFIGGYVVLPWGLVTPFFIVAPLATGIGALLAALGGSWAGTLLSPDGTRTRLLPVVLASEVTAALAVILLVAPILLGPLILRFSFGTVIIALGASWATWRFRGPRGSMDRGAAITLVLAMIVLILTLLVLNGSVIRGLFGPLSGVIAIPLGVLSGVAAVILGVVLMRGSYRNPGDVMVRDAALTLGLIGLPTPVFYGAYYLAFSLDLTSG
jgi:hypothetical protein